MVNHKLTPPPGYPQKNPAVTSCRPHKNCLFVTVSSRSSSTKINQLLELWLFAVCPSSWYDSSILWFRLNKLLPTYHQYSLIWAVSPAWVPIWFLIFLLAWGYRDVNRVKWNPIGQVNHTIFCSKNTHTYQFCQSGSPSKPWLYAAKFIAPHCTYAIPRTQHSAGIDWLHVAEVKVMWTLLLINKKCMCLEPRRHFVMKSIDVLGFWH